MPAGPGEEAERFAAAVELGRSPGRRGDDELARELDIVAMLRSRGEELGPTPDAKAAAKRKLQELLADTPTRRQPGTAAPLPPLPRVGDVEPVTELLREVAPAQDLEHPPTERLPRLPLRLDPVLEAELDAELDELAAELAAEHDRTTVPGPRTEPDPDDVATEESEQTPAAPGADRSRTLARAGLPGSGRHSRSRRPGGRAGSSPGRGLPRNIPLPRLTLVGSAVILIALALAGAGILASRNALPGDELYPVKRVSEAAGLALTFGDVSRAHRHLDLASTRLGEVEQLVKADPKASTDRPDLVNEALQQFDDSTGEGARILLGSDEASDAEGRDTLRSWAAQQSSRLAELRPALPAGTRGEDAEQLLERVVGRTAALKSQPDCPSGTKAVDDLGPLPSCGAEQTDRATTEATSDRDSDEDDPTSTESSATETDTTSADTTSADPESSTGTTTDTSTSPSSSRETRSGRTADRRDRGLDGAAIRSSLDNPPATTSTTAEGPGHNGVRGAGAAPGDTQPVFPGLSL